MIIAEQFAFGALSGLDLMRFCLRRQELTLNRTTYEAWWIKGKAGVEEVRLGTGVTLS